MPLGKPNPTIHGNRHVIFSPFFIAALLVCSLILTLPVSNAFAAQATLAWTPNTEADLAGYRIYYGTASDAYPWYVDVGDVVTYTIDGLDVGMNYYFSATAYDTANLESDYSNEVIHNTCTYGISPSSAQFTSPAATGTISILTQNGCASSASSSVSWVSITSGASGTGARNVVFSVSANTTTQQRSGNLTVANQTFVVTQEGAQAPVTYSLTASAGTGGTISPAGSVTVTQGASQTFTISAASGYQIDDVKVDGTSVGAVGSYTFSNVTAAHTIAATFKAQAPATYTLTIRKDGSGSGAVSTNPQVSSMPAGTSVLLTATPNADSVFSGWSGGCSGTDQTCSIVLAGNTTVTATFTLKTTAKKLNITALATSGGYISPAGFFIKVYQGSSKTFTITPRAGYVISDVKVNNTSVGPVTSYTFTNIQANQKIVASFKKTGQAPAPEWPLPFNPVTR